MKIRIKKSYLLVYLLVVLLCIGLIALAVFQGSLLFSLLAKNKSPNAPVAKSSPKPTDPRTAVLTFPQTNATDAVRKEYAATVAKYAKKTDTVSIANCKPEPVAAEVDYQKTITLKNPDTTPHTIATDKDHKTEVPAEGEATMIADFGKPSGIFAYGCDDSPNGVGVIAIPEK